MRRSSKILWVFFLLPCLHLSAQDRKALEQERFKIIEQIEVTSGFLDKTLEKKHSTLDDYQAIESQINYRQRLIDLVKIESKTINSEIHQNEEKLDSLKAQLSFLQEKYASILRWAYLKKRTSHPLSAILKAESLRDAFIKWRYFEQIRQFLQKKVRQIMDLENEIQVKNQQIVEKQQEKQTLLDAELSHFNILKEELNLKNELLGKLSTNESKFRKELAQKKKERERLNQAIEKIILAEMEARRKAAKNKNELALTPEVKALSQNFLDNKGRLPWPVARGIITQNFGKQRHPTLKNISIENNGIEIRSEPESIVRAVFRGEVVGVMAVPGHDNMIIIRHGEYYSVYSKLSEVFVENGQEVSTKQNLGLLSQNEHQNSELHLEIWKGKSKVNPAQWLVKK